MNATVVAAIGDPRDAAHRAAVVPFVPATAAVALVVLDAARERAVSVNDE